jgi:predicted dehydrogenase
MSAQRIPSFPMLTMKRREFLATSTLAAAGILTHGGRSLHAQDAGTAAPVAPGRKLKLGIVGCGDRGKWIGHLFKRHGGYEIYGLADYFPGTLRNAAKELKVPESRCFSGLSGYKRLLDTKPDAIAIITVSRFHPQMAADAIAAGVHVFLAKPIVVDVPGCHLVAETGKLATEKKLCMLVDFQTRSTGFYIEAMRRVHAGSLGVPIYGEGYYHNYPDRYRRLPSSPEERLRNWSVHTALSGDMIVEQNIHTLDVMNWAFNGVPPLHAFGTCGRKAWNVHAGDCKDYYTLHFQYPNNTGVTFNGRQFNAFGSLPDGIVFRLFGTKGTLETAYGGNVMLRSDEKNFYRGGKTTNIYEAGVVANIATFHRSIQTGDIPTRPSRRVSRATFFASSGAPRREAGKSSPGRKPCSTPTASTDNCKVSRADAVFPNMCLVPKRWRAAALTAAKASGRSAPGDSPFWKRAFGLSAAALHLGKEKFLFVNGIKNMSFLGSSAAPIRFPEDRRIPFERLTSSMSQCCTSPTQNTLLHKKIEKSYCPHFVLFHEKNRINTYSAIPYFLSVVFPFCVASLSFRPSSSILSNS